jgi:hypothetical protein
MMTQPPVKKVRTLQVPFRILIVRADPAYEAEKRLDLFYKFSNGREFNQNTARHGAYSDAPHDNPLMD